MRLVVLVALACLVPGCLLQGEDKAFADESDRVATLRVNAYAAKEGDVDVGVVETTGVGEDGSYHAFRGSLQVVLERQRPGASQPTYAHVRSWTIEVEEDDFASPTHPRHALVIPAGDFPEAGTYRARVVARIGGAAVPEGSALFDFPAR